jgi:hypothetical protein
MPTKHQQCLVQAHQPVLVFVLVLPRLLRHQPASAALTGAQTCLPPISSSQHLLPHHSGGCLPQTSFYNKYAFPPQVAAFPHYGSRWAEWNGHFRDTVRNFVRGMDGTAGAFAAAMCGSPNIYSDTNPGESEWWVRAPACVVCVCVCVICVLICCSL